MFHRLLLLFAAILCAVPAAADPYKLGTLVIDHPWSRSTAAGMPMGVAYLTITNHGKTADALIAASTTAAARAEFHQTTIVDGMARMRPLTEIVIPAGATVKIEPGGIHIMLVDLKAPLEKGKSVPLDLEFRGAGRLRVALSIEASDLTPAGM
jgi:copper(I)-binding protein